MHDAEAEFAVAAADGFGDGAGGFPFLGVGGYGGFDVVADGGAEVVVEGGVVGV